MKLTLAKKLYGVIGIILAVLMGVSISSYMVQKSLIKEFEDLESRNGVQIRNCLEAEVALGQAVQAFKNFVMRKDDKYVAEFRNCTAEIRKIIKGFQPLNKDNTQERAGLEKAMELVDPYEKTIDTLVEANKKNPDIVTLDKLIRGADRPIAAALKDRAKLVKEDYESKKAAIAAQSSRIVGVQIAASVIALVIGGLLAFLVTRGILKSIIRTGEVVEKASQGDLQKEVEITSNDEIGEMAKKFNTMINALRQMIKDITTGVQTLSSSSTELAAVSGQTASGVKAMSEKAGTVAAAAEEASSNTNSVAASIKQASANLSSVASATEEMSATVAEIASNSEKGRAISEQAMEQAQAISAMMQQLGEAAKEIGKVTETITDISSQTNLLALNATIEAARAGAAGKGFAVVANEIKELARQTAAATEDIKAKITGVQTSAGGAIADIEKITGVIKEVGTIVSGIAAAIEEQATVTKDVAGNIAQASDGVKEANERVAQTATVSKSIASDVAAVNASVGEIRQGGEQVQISAGELSKLSEQLRGMVEKFKV